MSYLRLRRRFYDEKGESFNDELYSIENSREKPLSKEDFNGLLEEKLIRKEMIIVSWEGEQYGLSPFEDGNKGALIQPRWLLDVKALKKLEAKYELDFEM